MADNFGLSFMPGAQQQDPSGNPTGQRPSPVQQAIQTLALRIPRTVGAASGAPQELLMGAGGSALGGNPNSAALLEQLRRWLFGNGAAPRMSLPGGPIGAGPGDGAITRPLPPILPPNFGYTHPDSPSQRPLEPAPQPAPLPAPTPRPMPSGLGNGAGPRGPRDRQV